MMRFGRMMKRPLLLAAKAGLASAIFVTAPPPAGAQSPRFCATERALGRYPEGCPPQATQSTPVVSRPVRTSRTRPQRPPTGNDGREQAAPASRLTPGAIAIRDALAVIPQADWLASQPPWPIEQRIWSLGTPNDMQALAQSGNRRAQYLMGAHHFVGSAESPRNAAQSLTWLRRASDAGEARADVTIGEAYAEGFGVEGSYFEARRWYARAAEGGAAAGRHRLGILYENGTGVPQDYVRAREMYQQAADQGYLDSQTNLGALYANGRGGPVDYPRALALFRYAAGRGNNRAYGWLGWHFENGRGVAQNYPEALRAYREGGARGDFTSQFNAGRLLYEGAGGLPVNQSEGLTLLRRAAASGLQAARTYLTQRNLPLQ